jgi:hypothetical protein
LITALGCVSIPDTRTLVGELGGSGGSVASGGKSGSAGAAEGGSPEATGGTAGSDTAGSAGMAGGAGAGGRDAVECTAQPPELALPLIVDDYFVPSGYAADPEANVAAIGQTTCMTRPGNATGLYGLCYRWYFAPTEFDVNGYGTATIFWQGPPDNWGGGPGLAVAAEASAVTFRAWSEDSGLQAKFFVGGAVGAACSDEIAPGSAQLTVPLMTTPSDYSLTMTGRTYDGGVINGFGFSVSLPSGSPTAAIYIDNIRWE